MTSSSLEARVANVEGIISQIDVRLASIENRLDRLEDRVNTAIGSLESRMLMYFMAMVGLLASSWVTIILAILLRT